MHGDREGKGSPRTQCEKWLCVTWILYTNDTNIATARLMLSGALVCWLLSRWGLQQHQPDSAGGSTVVPAATSASSPLRGAEQAQDTQQPEEPAVTDILNCHPSTSRPTNLCSPLAGLNLSEVSSAPGVLSV